MRPLRTHHKAIHRFAAQKAEQASAAGSDAAFFKPAQIACPAGTALHVLHVPTSALLSRRTRQRLARPS